MLDPYKQHGSLRNTVSFFRRVIAESGALPGMVYAVVIVIAIGAVMGLSPLLMKYVIDEIDTPKAGLVPFVLIGAFAIIHWLARTASAVRDIVFISTERKIYRSLGGRAFIHVMNLPLYFHLERRTGELSQVINNGLHGNLVILQQSIMVLLPAIIEFTFVSGVLIWLGQPELLLLLIAALTLYGALFALGLARVKSAARSVMQADMQFGGVFTDALLNYETVKYFGTEGVVYKQVDSALENAQFAALGVAKVRARSTLLTGTVFAAIIAGTLCYSAYLAQSGDISIGEFVLVNTYLFQLASPIEALGHMARQISESVVALNGLVVILAECVEKDPCGGIKTIKGNERRVEFDRVCFSYKIDNPVLVDLSFQIEPGQTIGIVGASGAGKSTLVRLLMRLVEPSCGRILINGVSISEVAVRELRKAISLVPQDTVLLNESIAKNIEIGKPNSKQTEIEAAAKLANLHEFIMTLPDKYATKVGERGIKLSGGERQRVAIARAALRRSGLYVFDEATSSLDSATERMILKNIRELSRSSTTMVIAHRLSTIVDADIIFVLDKGCIAEQGTHASLLERDGKYAELWRTQHREEDLMAH